jgi:DNA integrity scanning protein DisA with diadenylate cyclase activity
MDSLFYAVRKYIKTSQRWEDISYYNQDGNFLGAANHFLTKEQAQQYLDSYKQKLNNRLNIHGRAKTSQTLRVFEVVSAVE